MFSRLPCTLIGILAVLLTTFTLVAAAEKSGEKPQAKTTIDQELPVDELELILKPFTKTELLVEAEGWQALVREKAVAIALAEIAVKRQTKEIEKAEEIEDQTKEAMKELEQVKDQTKEAQLSGESKDLQKAEKEAEVAQTKIEAVHKTLTEAEDAADKTAEIYDYMSDKSKQSLEETVVAADTAKEAVEKVHDLVDDSEGKDVTEVKKTAMEASQASTEAEEAIEDVSDKAEKTAASLETDKSQALLDDTVEVMGKAQEAHQKEKLNLLDNLNSLREERTKLVDNLRAVVDELEQKTDKGDSKTLAIVKDYRLYIHAVSGINIDVSDTTSAKVAISGWLTSPEGGLRWAKNLTFFFGILIGAWFLSRILSAIVRRAMNRVHSPQLLSQFLIGAVRWVVFVGGIFVALAALEISVAPLLALVGAAGFIVAFALQDSLSNFASGLMILFFRPFDVNDLVDAGGVSGKVTSMNLVATTIRTPDNKVMIVPNNAIFSNVITNSTSVYKRRVDMEFGIGYDDDIDQALSILNEIVTNHPKVLKKPEPTIKVGTLADSSVKFICRPWTRSGNYWDVYWDVTKEVKKRFDTEGIGIPYPQQDVHLYIQDAPSGSALSKTE